MTYSLSKSGVELKHMKIYNNKKAAYWTIGWPELYTRRLLWALESSLPPFTILEGCLEFTWGQVGNGFNRKGLLGCQQSTKWCMHRTLHMQEVSKSHWRQLHQKGKVEVAFWYGWNLRAVGNLWGTDGKTKTWKYCFDL